MALQEPGEIISFAKRRRGDVSYTWGGPASGYEFAADSRFAEYVNVGCSDESDPVKDSSEHWHVDGDRQLVIEGDRRRLRFSLVALDQHVLVLRVREIVEKPN